MRLLPSLDCSPRLRPLGLVLLAACLLHFSGQAAQAAVPTTAQTMMRPAPPASVTVYPDGARVFVTQAVPVVDGKVRLSLPPGAEADSLALSLAGRTVESLSITPVPVVDSPEVRQLRSEFEAARADVARMEGELTAVQARKALWAKPETRITQVVELERLDQLMADRLSALHVSEGQLENRLELARAARDRLHQAVRLAGGLATDALAVTAHVSPPASGTAQATLTYTLSGCGWRPVYRLTARPNVLAPQPSVAKTESAIEGEPGSVRFIQEAEITQGSGQDWIKTRVALATADPGSGLDPAPLQPWLIRQWQRPQPRAALMAQASNDAMLKAAPMEMKTSAPAREQATFTTWDIGVRDLRTGVPVRAVLAEETWSAAFSRVIRPSLDTRAYLCARITLPEPRTLPQGAATFSVEDETVGSGPFTLSGDTATLFFGVDPRVQATMKLDTRQSGRKGFVDRQQTRVWSWSIEVKNSHTTGTSVQVEDPQPQSADQAIVIEAVSDPKPQEKDHIYLWNLTLPAGGTQTITHSITVSAPTDMTLQEGR